MKLSRWPFTQFSCIYDTYCVILSNKRVFISLSHQACCEKLEFLKAGYRKLHEYAIITSHAPGKWEPKVHYNPGGAFYDVSIRVVLSSSAESEYENGLKKNNIVLQAGWQISTKQSPNTITSGHLGPVSTEPFFFLMSSSVVFFLLYGMPSSILYFLSLLMFAFIHFIAPLPPCMQECVCSFPWVSRFHQLCIGIFATLFALFSSHSMWSPLRPQTSSLLSFSSTIVEQFYSVILTPVKTSPPPQAYLPFK